MKSKLKSIFLILTVFLSMANVSVQGQEGIEFSGKLQAMYNEAAEKDMIPVAIWIDGLDYERIETEVKNKIMSRNLEEILHGKSSGDMLSTNNMDSIPAAEIHEYRAMRTKTYEKATTELNSAFIDSSLPTNEIIFSGKLSPLVIANVTKAQLKNLSSQRNISKMSYFENKKAFPSSNISLPTQGFDAITGPTNIWSGVSVGVLESLGYADKDIVTSFNSGITFLNASYYEASQNIDTHATIVCSQIAQIVPDANLMQAYAPDSLSYMEGAEGLILYDCDVINSSMYIPSATGECDGVYQPEDEFVDYLSYNYKTTFVTAAGNNDGSIVGSENIHTPGLAYNCITVGMFDDRNTLSRADDIISALSSYDYQSGLAHKPEIYASGVNISIIGYNVTGTSVAAPYVTSAVALILQESPGYSLLPPMLKSMIVSNAKSVQGSHFLNVSQLDDYVLSSYGSGDRSGWYNMINADNSNINRRMKIALSWERCTGSSANPPLINYNIKVTDPDGSVVAQSNSSTNNTEVLEFVLTEEGRYRLDITRLGLFGSNPRFGLSAYYMN